MSGQPTWEEMRKRRDNPMWLGTLPKLSPSVPPKVRTRTIRKMHKMLREMELDENTIKHWNAAHPDETPLDPDEGGLYARIRFQIHAVLAAEAPQ